MAGLGFSMAVVGLSIGIFVGFILWKGRLGLPYYYCSTRRELSSNLIGLIRQSREFEYSPSQNQHIFQLKFSEIH